MVWWCTHGHHTLAKQMAKALATHYGDNYSRILTHARWVAQQPRPL